MRPSQSCRAEALSWLPSAHSDLLKIAGTMLPETRPHYLHPRLSPPGRPARRGPPACPEHPSLQSRMDNCSFLALPQLRPAANEFDTALQCPSSHSVIADVAQ